MISLTSLSFEENQVNLYVIVIINDFLDISIMMRMKGIAVMFCHTRPKSMGILREPMGDEIFICRHF